MRGRRRPGKRDVASPLAARPGGLKRGGLTQGDRQGASRAYDPTLALSPPALPKRARCGITPRALQKNWDEVNEIGLLKRRCRRAKVRRYSTQEVSCASLVLL